MQSEMAKKLKKLLDGISQQDFDQKWAAVEALKLNGPLTDEVLQSFSSNQYTIIEQIGDSPIKS